MLWFHVTPNSVNLTYIFLGLFTSIFILLSGVIKNKLYLGEANIAFLAGIILGPRVANVFDPTQWHDPDALLLQCTRVVLVIQCFAVAVQLRKRYVEREWRSLAWMLIPVMIWGWLISSLGIYFMARSLSWIECMACASCFNAIDPILAATVINGKAAERVPKHLRDLLLAESACNDVTTTLALELSTQVIQYAKSPRTITFRFFVLTIGYEVIFGALAGLIIGYAAHWAVKAATKHETMDRTSFLSFYFVFAIFCTGVGALLGVDEVLLGFCAGYAFDIDDWFQEKTEESKVSDVIDLLLNLTFFVLMGSIIPWHSYNSPELNIVPWRLVVGTVIIIAFRRIPIVMVLQSYIPATRTWQESLFTGYFAPIGGGAIFSALIIKAQLESGGSRGHDVGSSAETPFHLLTASIWPIVTFVVLCSSIIHGTTAPLFLLGREVTSLAVTVSFGSDSDSGWMTRLPKFAGSPSFRRSRSSSLSQSEVRRSFFPVIKPEVAVLTRDRDPAPSCKRATQKDDLEARRRGTPARAYQYGHTILVEDEAGQVLKQLTLPAVDSGPSTFEKVKSALQGRQLPSLPQVLISVPEEEAISRQQPASLQRANRHLTQDEDIIRQINLDPTIHVRAANEDNFLQALPSAVLFQLRRRSITFEDDDLEGTNPSAEGASPAEACQDAHLMLDLKPAQAISNSRAL